MRTCPRRLKADLGGGVVLAAHLIIFAQLCTTTHAANTDALRPARGSWAKVRTSALIFNAGANPLHALTLDGAELARHIGHALGHVLSAHIRRHIPPHILCHISALRTEAVRQIGHHVSEIGVLQIAAIIGTVVAAPPEAWDVFRIAPGTVSVVRRWSGRGEVHVMGAPAHLADG